MSYCLFFDRNTQVVQDKSAVGHQCELCYVVHFGGGNQRVTHYHYLNWVPSPISCIDSVSIHKVPIQFDFYYDSTQFSINSHRDDSATKTFSWL